MLRAVAREEHRRDAPRVVIDRIEAEQGPDVAQQRAFGREQEALGQVPVRREQVFEFLKARVGAEREAPPLQARGEDRADREDAPHDAAVHDRHVRKALLAHAAHQRHSPVIQASR